MRPVRFVALAEDGRSLVLKDESGRMLSLAIDERVAAAIKTDRAGVAGQLAMEMESALTPRDIQARIRSGQSAEEVAKAANTPLEKILRFAGPVLQERAMIADHARRTRLRTSESGSSLSAVVDVRLAGHGVDPDAVEWDAYRRETGTWRVVASWPSGKATAYAGLGHGRGPQRGQPDRPDGVVPVGGEAAGDPGARRDRRRAGPRRRGHPGAAADVADLGAAPAPAHPPRAGARARAGRSADPAARASTGRADPAAAVRTQPAAKAKPEHLPHTEPEPEPEPVQPEPQRAEAASGSGSRRGKPELPGWDDILFGARPHRN
ncbi:septation protein SepH [Fodinicola feengrottensis]|uniref:septation protein SepH n=1 Tax=Fodinicola feengrottensis TaxID=435914 RepID=UPI002441AB17|nr:septation protein SepH [Fodinicola feengrottensis]